MSVHKNLPIRIPPGFVSDGSLIKPGEVRWTSGNLVRFEGDTVVPYNGWTRLKDSTLTDFPAVSGTPRFMHGYGGDNGSFPTLMIGTSTKLYGIVGGTLLDLTPAGFAALTETGIWQDGTMTGFKPGQSLTDVGTWSISHLDNRMVGAAGGKVYAQTGVATAAPVDVQTLDAAHGPRGDAVVVTPERFIFALGAWSPGESQIQAGQRVMWASQGTNGTWTPAAGNTAGSVILSTPGRLMGGRATRSQTLLWTDSDLHVATYIGGDLVYRFDRVADKCGLFGRNSVVMVGDTAYWLSPTGFYSYDGAVRKIECPVFDAVFFDLETNYPQRNKVWAVSHARYGEVTWYYCSTTGQPDRYVTYNYDRGYWTYGVQGWGCGIDAGVMPTAVHVGAVGGVIVGMDTTLPDTGATPWIESSAIRLAEGDNVMLVNSLTIDALRPAGLRVTARAGIVPAITGAFNETVEISARSFDTLGKLDATAGPCHFKARTLRLKFEYNGVSAQADWKLGEIMVGMVPGGRR